MGQEERTAGRPAEGPGGPEEDGIELEVSDLRGRPAASPGPGGTAGPAPVTRRGLPAILASRRARTATVAALVALVCAGLLLSLPGTQSSLRQALAGPTPTPTTFLAYTEFTIGFFGGVPWGTLTVDGKPGDQRSGQGTILSRGRHTVAYRAAPFAPLDCRLSVPKRPDDTCALSTVGFGSLGSARIVDLGANFERLPSDQRDALARAVDAALRADPPTATVEPGDHYLGAGGAVAVAPAPLQATLALALNADPARVLPAGGPIGGCVDLCDGYYYNTGNPNDAWSVTAHAVARWQFAAADGAPIQPEGPGAQLDTPVTVRVRWSDGGWSVTRNTTPETYNDLCYSAFAALPQPTPPPGGVGTSTGVIAAPDVADGCVELITPYQATGGPPPPSGVSGTPTPTPNPATAPLLFYRFGVLLAANEAAHAALPQLPMANAHERALALQWQPPSA